MDGITRYELICAGERFLMDFSIPWDRYEGRVLSHPDEICCEIQWQHVETGAIICLPDIYWRKASKYTDEVKILQAGRNQGQLTL